MPTTNEMCFMPAVELARTIRAGGVAPSEMVEALLDRINVVNPEINAFTIVLADQARESARRADEQLASTNPDELGSLFGVPFVIKDMTPVAGVRTSFGSKAFADYVPDESSPVYQRLINAGGIFIGKTTTPEFAFTGVTESPLTGITRNPWNPGRTAGGSSGGSAAAVAAGMATLANGSDGGGSIRVPAACCGVVGLKPSCGRVPVVLEDAVFETTTHCGPIARTVSDVALMLNVLAGPDDRDPFSLPKENVDYVAYLESDLPPGLRIGFSANLGFGPVEGRVVERTRSAAATLAEVLGGDVDEFEPHLPDVRAIYETIWPPVAALIVGEELKPRIPQEAISEVLLLLAEQGCDTLATDFYRMAVMARSDLYLAINALFDRYDFLVTPTMPLPPFPHTQGKGGPTEIAGQPVKPWNWLYLTEPFNFTGHPAISVPCGLEEGLPLGMQIIARRHADAQLLRVAAAYEDAVPLPSLADGNPVA